MCIRDSFLNFIDYRITDDIMTSDKKNKTIFRDVSWLSFNGRVLQEAADSTVPLRERIRFLGIFSNNLDEFFRVRVATLRRMVSVGEKSKMHLENNAQEILDDIQMTVLNLSLIHISEPTRLLSISYAVFC